MRLPRVRFTVRRRMTVVAVVTVVFGARRYAFLAREYQGETDIASWKAAYFRDQERRHWTSTEGWQRGEDKFRKSAAFLPSPSFPHVLLDRAEADRGARLA